VHCRRVVDGRGETAEVSPPGRMGKSRMIGEEGEPPAKKGRTSDEEERCALCFKSPEETDEKALRSHGCATCAPGAWGVCEACHIALLSRDCPLCRSPYESLELFPFPFSSIPPPDLEWRVFSAVVQHNTNVCLWNVATRQASFMLAPHCPGASGDAGCHVAIPGVDLTSHRFGSPEGGLPRFLFDTSLWETLEQDDGAQEDEEDTIEITPAANAPTKVREWLIAATKDFGGGVGGCGGGGAVARVGGHASEVTLEGGGEKPGGVR